MLFRSEDGSGTRPISEFDQKIKEMGLVPLPSSPEEFRQVQLRDIETWRDRVKKSGAQVD